MTDDDHLEVLRKLMRPDVSLERAYYEINRRHLDGRAAAATVEALIFSLRERATAALKEAPTWRRLGKLSEPQLHELCARLQGLRPQIARPWPADEIKRLVETWSAHHV
jgi:hypothetical protein